MIKESEYYFKVIETEFNKPFTMAKKFHKDSKNSATCWICKKVSAEFAEKVKVKDHVTGKYWSKS